MVTTGGAATGEGDNLMYFARKEQCLVLGTQLRAFKPRIEGLKSIESSQVVILNFYQKMVFFWKVNEAEKRLATIQGE